MSSSVLDEQQKSNPGKLRVLRNRLKKAKVVIQDLQQRLTIAETKISQGATKLTNLEDRVEALENQP